MVRILRMCCFVNRCLLVIGDANVLPHVHLYVVDVLTGVVVDFGVDIKSATDEFTIVGFFCVLLMNEVSVVGNSMVSGRSIIFCNSRI
ncbi:MAG: hypothetical protein ACYCPT_12295 [Acidimicrobiales bacterium]